MSCNTYKEALEEAGSIVYEYKFFGDYQGQWWAKVKYNNTIGWIHGYYGSCTVCDAFQSEFGYSSHEHGDDTYYPLRDGFVETCTECMVVRTRIITFGQSYLENMMSQSKAELKAKENIEWDLDAEKMVQWLYEHAIEK